MIDIIIVICCSLLGFVIGKYIERRIRTRGEFYCDLQKYLSMLKTNIEGRQLELEHFNDDFCCRCSEVFREYLKNDKIKCRLTSIQRSDVANFFQNLGCVNTMELNKHIDYYSVLFASEGKLINEGEVTKATLYPKLGILLGVMIGILLI